MPAAKRQKKKAEPVAAPVEPSSEISVPESHNDRESDSDFEEPAHVIVAAAKRKRQRKAPEGGGRQRKAGGGGGGRGRKKSGEEEDAGTGSMFDVVRGGRSSLQSSVDDWIEKYKNDRDAALLELIQFFVQSSGCKGKISPYMYANQEHSEIIRKMTEEFDEDSGDYPLIMSGPQWKKFRSNFCEYVQVLVRQCQYSIIYDQYMMDNIISLLTGLTDSQVRAFRHTSTLAAMKLMTALVDVALNLSINLDNTQRQYEAERQKQQTKRANDRLDMLLQRRQELEENQAEIRNMLTYIFKGVFVHRYRDAQPEIRSICIAEIGVWMKRYPNMFLDDGYLKYVGWTLYDKVGEVRLHCLRALQPLYNTEDLAHKLELFTNRFKDRIVEMTLDKEYEVAVQGIKLVISILKFNDTILGDKDCENVYELVYSSQRQVAQAAGEFLNAKLFRKDEELTRTLKIHKGKKQSLNAPLIRDLVQFFIESELHEHGAYLVDSLWDINDMMRDWECMTDLLLEEPPKGEEPLDDRQETSLIEIMVCCVKQAATGESPVGRGPNRKLTAKESKQVMEDKTRLTEHFIATLPQLLLKYLMDPEKVANLLTIPQYFNLEIYTASRQEKNLELTLRYLHEVVEKHTDTEVLEASSKCYECLCNEDYAIAGKCDVARKTLIDSLVAKFKEAMQDFFAEGEEPDEDEMFALVACLKRIYAFYSCHNLTSWNLWDDLFHIIKAGNDNQLAIPEEIISKAISSCSMAILWYLQALDTSNPDKNRMRMLRKRLEELMRHCHELMFHQQDKVTEESYITICDLLIVFSKHLGDNGVMKPLVFEPDKTLQTQLSNFLTEKVFVEDEDDDVDENVKIEELHKRRNFLACFCKLVVYNIVSIRVAADMFKHYMKFYNDYGDIIKATLAKAREINKVTTAKTLALSLTQLFRELHSEQGMIDRSSEAFQSLKELARRFALSFGLDQIKNREAVAAMHKEGILYGLAMEEGHEGPPTNIAFLEVLCEFTNKLMKQDKKVVLNYLDKHLPATGIPQSNRNDEWQSLITYRNSLVQGEHEIHPITLKQASQRRYGKRKADVSDHDSSTGDWGEPPTPAPSMAPQLTSTAIKRRRADEESIGAPSEPGSEQDFQDSGNVGMSQMSQVSWMNAQKQQQDLQRQMEPNYSRMRPPSNLPPGTPQIDTDQSSEEASIHDFESPQMMASTPAHPSHQYPGAAHHRQYQAQVHPSPQGYYDDGSQHIEDPSSDMSHPGF
ncbi:cohesin subunit SA-2-like isoform X2 [Mizuhopecten yessoensis]|uniref:Cohesin subunit SA-1 n=1 Tax=Mizuhopecten yessoensis TaxID=6573 RepID=A0A210QT48_MIZYE|nr:cohesin subunit SA-2-like isoform X2 [Mizuhopecten yessoensis]OWF51899.1 Cohesin subunit SA-1 [Mizuhopecten yessoensis]